MLRQLTMIGLSVILCIFSSCNDKKSDDPRIELKVETIGEVIFSKEGGIFPLSIKAYTVSIGENLSSQLSTVSPSFIDVGIENSNFTVLTAKIENDYLIVEIEAKENKEPSLVYDKLIVSTQLNNLILSNTVDLSQQAAEITYKRFITCEKGTHIAIPANGGIIEIPISSKQEVYINGKYDTTLDASLAGLSLEHIETNCAGLHRLSYKNDTSVIGRYIFTYTAIGPYNLNFEWDGESDDGLIMTKSYFVIKDRGVELLKIDFTQPQTPGEEYFWGMASTYSREFIRD